MGLGLGLGSGLELGLELGLEQALSTRSSLAPRRRCAQPLSPHAAPG